MVLLTAALASLLLAVPGLRPVLQELRHVGGGWLTLALVLELASCASFVVVFRHFFDGLPARFAQQLAWTEMGSGALLPGGGVGSLAVGGWLLHRVGMPTKQIVQRSSALFFLTSATSVAALTAGGLFLATGASLGPPEALYAWLPMIAGTTVFAVAIGLPLLARRREWGAKGPAWLGDLVAGVTQATRALLHPRWRLLGAIGYLGFDIAVLWAALTAIGYSPPLAVLILAYVIGYLANIVPIPGGVGVLEAGLVGTLILYGAPVVEATAGVVMYHAIAFWIPSLGGLLAYNLLRRHEPASHEDRRVDLVLDGAAATPAVRV